jgi:hypothetical protein
VNIEKPPPKEGGYFPDIIEPLTPTNADFPGKGRENG